MLRLSTFSIAARCVRTGMMGVAVSPFHPVWLGFLNALCCSEVFRGAIFECLMLSQAT